MIIQFTLGNYRSFHELQTLNFRPTGVISEDKTVDICNIFGKGDNSLLKIVGIYGPNASGKSNLIRGLLFLKDMISTSIEAESFLEFEHNPFRLSDKKSDQSGYFQVVLLLKKKKYRYGFTLDAKANIQTEWLFGPADRNETYYFTRKGAKITINEDRFKEGTQLPYENKLRPDALFLTFCSSYSGEISGMIKDFFSEQVISQSPELLSRRFMRVGNNRTLTDKLVNSGKKSTILKWMAEAGLLFSDITLQDIVHNKIKYGNYVMLTKNVYNDKGEVTSKIDMNLDYDESDGTRKFYAYIGGLYEVFTKGGIYVSDEIDSNFHPSLLLKMIRLFQNPEINTAGAQLLFTSHDVNLMDPEVMRRDQFYFTEKSNADETNLYSLADLKGIRNNADFARQYLAGFYGALPKLGSFLEDSGVDETNQDTF